MKCLISRKRIAAARSSSWRYIVIDFGFLQPAIYKGERSVADDGVHNGDGKEFTIGTWKEV